MYLVGLVGLKACRRVSSRPSRLVGVYLVGLVSLKACRRVSSRPSKLEGL